jgi:DNA-binding SARP family transcriptional activator
MTYWPGGRPPEPPRTRIRAMLAGSCALVTLIAVVVGLPLILYRFGGSPLPRHLASWHRAMTVITSPDTGMLLLGVVRELSWICWLAFTVAVLAEVQAAARGRTPPRLWLGAVQAGAGKLVALAALTFAAAPVVAPSAAFAAMAHVQRDPHPGPAGTQDVAAARLVTVRPGDCLWEIASHYLGAGDRYPEIASMNYGHDMGDGQVFTNPALIEPGWRLQVPAADAGGGHAAGRPLRHLGHATRDVHFRRQHPAALLRPAPDQHATASQAVGARAADRYQTSAAVSATGGQQVPEAAVFGVGALAGAVLTSLTRLRWRQRQHRGRGRRIALPPDPDVLAAEQRLRASVQAEPSATLQEALRCLESGIAGSGQPLPDIVGLHVTTGLLEVLLATPAPQAPPPPFDISPGRQGMCWQLDLPAAALASGLPAALDGGTGLLPGLFTAGATSAGCLLLDLESLQVTGCDGDAVLVDQVVCAVGTELATGQVSGWYELILVGFDELEPLGRADHCPDLDAALSLLDQRCAAVRGRLAGEPSADVRQLRLNAPDDEDWGLTILVSRTEPAPDQLAHLLELAEDGPGGVAALVAGDAETPDGRMAPTVFQLAPDPEEPDGIVANIVPLQIVVRPQLLPETEYQAVGALVAAACDLTDVRPNQAPYQMYGAPPWIPQAAVLSAGDELAGHDWVVADELAGEPADAGQPADAGGRPDACDDGDGDAVGTGQQQLSVQILGPFAVTGAAQVLQPQQAELVLALALAAPAGLTNSALCSMLGADPDHPKPSDAVRQIITRTRRRLGRAADGREYIMHTGNGNYRLHPDVSLDWAQFRALTSAGRADDMRAALELIRGQPFAGSYHWWVDIPLIETIRAEVVDAAHTLAEFELATGSPRPAARAARAGLLAEASAEQLWRLLMQAEHAAGNLGGVTEAWRRCLDAIEDIAPGGEPHPDTVALYQQLTGARQRAPARG